MADLHSGFYQSMWRLLTNGTISIYSPCVGYRRGRDDRNWTTVSL